MFVLHFQRHSAYLFVNIAGAGAGAEADERLEGGAPRRGAATVFTCICAFVRGSKEINAAEMRL
jgi:hypothetical protein